MLKEIISINIGRPIVIEYNGKELKTGLYKKQISEPIYLGKINFAGDAQADLIHHGGEDKAVCVYPYEHYIYWEKVLNRKLDNGAFGENLTVKGMVESSVCIGDIYQISGAKVQVSQPRQPCFKLANRYGDPQLIEKVQTTGYTGYYFKVLEEGWVNPNDTIELLEKHHLNITIQFANNIMHHDKENRDAIQEILAVDSLSASWRETLTKRLLE
ncbi:MOSC domain-containing protein [Bacillus sp. Marseille-P3661]|uniref:MOSC domain-containing protein n=1 Tax=Bacillus sp. Marseille-P3661 TaxID=1936234 RepID=UPI000C823355|nr:MOSC domain-containing protein [Bacillus sp. Marseille-P3661]